MAGEAICQFVSRSVTLCNAPYGISIDFTSIGGNDGGIGFAALLLQKEIRGLNSKLLIGLGVIILAIATGQCLIAAVTPTDEIRIAVTQVVEILKEPGMKSPKERKSLFKNMEKVVDPIFDFQEMAKSSLALHWRDLTPQERLDFVSLFKEFLAQHYLDEITSSDIEKVLYARETQDQNFAEVDTKVFTGTGETITVGYLLEKSSPDWKVYDVIVDDVSIVNNYRAQFDRVISQSSFQELVARIKEKTDGNS